MYKLVNLILITFFIFIIVLIFRKMIINFLKKLDFLNNIIRQIKIVITLKCKSKTAKGLIKLVNLPYTYYHSGPYQNIFNDYYLKLKEGKEKGFTPVMVICDAPLLSYLKEIYSFYEPKKAIKSVKMSKTSGKRILDNLFKRNYLENKKMFHFNMKEFTGKKCKDAGKMYFSSIYDYYEDGILESIIFEVQSNSPWEALAYFPFYADGYFDNITDTLKIFKYFYEEYGAEPAIIGFNTTELFLPASTPKTKSLDAAKNLFAINENLVNRGTDSKTLNELASILEVSNVWTIYYDQSNLNKLLNDILLKELWKRKINANKNDRKHIDF